MWRDTLINITSASRRTDRRTGLQTGGDSPKSSESTSGHLPETVCPRSSVTKFSQFRRRRRESKRKRKCFSNWRLWRRRRSGGVQERRRRRWEKRRRRSRRRRRWRERRSTMRRSLRRRRITSCPTSITERSLEATATTTWTRLFTETPALRAHATFIGILALVSGFHHVSLKTVPESSEDVKTSDFPMCLFNRLYQRFIVLSLLCEEVNHMFLLDDNVQLHELNMCLHQINRK